MIESSDDDADCESQQAPATSADQTPPAVEANGDTTDDEKPKTKRRRKTKMENGTAAPPSVSRSGSSSSGFAKVSNQSIGFIGLGKMGMPVADSLRKRAKHMVVHTRSDSMAKYQQLSTPLARRGPKASQQEESTTTSSAHSPRDVFRSTDIVFVCVGTRDDLTEVVFGEDGIVSACKSQSGAASRKGVVNMTTVDLKLNSRIDKVLSEHGVSYLEAAMLGNAEKAAQGGLVLLCSGSRGLFDEVHRLLTCLSRKAVFLDDVGNGARMKLCIEALRGLLCVGVAEVLQLADRAGLSGPDVSDVLRETDLTSPFLDYASRQMCEGVFDPEIRLSQMLDVMNAASSMADSLDQPAYLMAAAIQVMKLAKQRGEEDMDFTAVFRALENS